MEYSNRTSSVHFFLLGLSTDPQLKVIYFFVFLMIYLITISANLFLILVVRINRKLQTPMYFFLTHLSIIDLSFASSIVPLILLNTISTGRSISLDECAAQMFFTLVLGATECLLLAVMAVDRYAAICKPLHYTSYMNRKLCIGLASVAWGGGFVNSTAHVILAFRLPFCKSHYINHYFCEVPALLRLACRDTRLNEIGEYVATGIITCCAFMLTIVSYANIIFTIVKIRTSQGRKKAFSTCASHLTVVILYYGAITFIYLQPNSSLSPETDKVISIVYTVVIPMLNPLIYSVRNKDVKASIMKNSQKQTNLVKKP